MKIFSISSSLNSRACDLLRKIQSPVYCSYRTHSSRKTRVRDPLYSRISPLGDPKLSVVPTLDQWIAEGNNTHKPELQRIIQELTNYRRFKHALEVSFWMTNKRNFPLAPIDAATRLKLICSVFGLRQAEDYFNKIPEALKTHQVYIALLNCYAIAETVDKAESLMQTARDLGYATKPIWYNLMMNLHCRLGNRKKVRDLLREMEEKGVSYDQFTLSVLIKACTEALDTEGIDKIVEIMDQNPWSVEQWRTPVIAAQGYLRVGSIDKALTMLNKLEVQVMACKQKDMLFVSLFKLYAQARNKDRLYRVWNLYKTGGKGVTKVYKGMMHSLKTLGDFEGMKKIYEEWESSELHYDFRMANFLVEAYCARGDMEKAQAMMTEGISKGGDPFVATWCHFAGGYLTIDEMPPAIDALKRAISICPPRFASHKETLVACLEHLEKGDGVRIEEVKESIKSVCSMGVLRKDEWIDLVVKGKKLQSLDMFDC